MTEKHECGFCGKAFRAERTLLKHVCEQKRRESMKEVPHARLAYNLFRAYYRLEHHQPDKSFEAFRKSKFYTAFVRFGKFCEDTQVLDTEEFMKFLLKNRIPIDKWPDDGFYAKWAKQFVMRETWGSALRRSVEFIEKWGRQRAQDPADFFRAADEVELAYWIQSGRISPYVIFIAESGRARLSQLMGGPSRDKVTDIIVPSFWAEKVDPKKPEAQQIKAELAKLGL